MPGQNMMYLHVSQASQRPPSYVDSVIWLCYSAHSLPYLRTSHTACVSCSLVVLTDSNVRNKLAHKWSPWNQFRCIHLESTCYPLHTTPSLLSDTLLAPNIVEISFSTQITSYVALSIKFIPCWQPIQYIFGHQ
jgi:hypothetical protein